MKKQLLTLSIFVMLISFAQLAKAQKNVLLADSTRILKARRELLKESTSLNKLRLKLASTSAQIPGLEDKLNKANERSAKSAVESRDLATKMNDNIGDHKLAKKARRAAKTSYNDARTAQKLTDELKSTKQKVSNLEGDIEKLKAKIEKMDEQLKFTGNVN